jgi:hypothetical protein
MSKRRRLVNISWAIRKGSMVRIEIGYDLLAEYQTEAPVRTNVLSAFENLRV